MRARSDANPVPAAEAEDQAANDPWGVFLEHVLDSFKLFIVG
jgi:hypothetical protein